MSKIDYQQLCWLMCSRLLSFILPIIYSLFTTTTSYYSLSHTTGHFSCFCQYAPGRGNVRKIISSVRKANIQEIRSGDVTNWAYSCLPISPLVTIFGYPFLFPLWRTFWTAPKKKCDVEFCLRGKNIHVHLSDYRGKISKLIGMRYSRSTAI